MIYYRDSRLLHESTHRHPMLVEVMHQLDLEAEKVGWEKVIVTSIFRTLAENRAAKAKTLIHCCVPHRAADIRIRDQMPHITELVGKILNATFEYNHEKPELNVAFWAVHGDGPHLHLQVHPNTRRRA